MTVIMQTLNSARAPDFSANMARISATFVHADFLIRSIWMNAQFGYAVGMMSNENARKDSILSVQAAAELLMPGKDEGGAALFISDAVLGENEPPSALCVYNDGNMIAHIIHPSIQADAIALQFHENAPWQQSLRRIVSDLKLDVDFMDKIRKQANIPPISPALGREPNIDATHFSSIIGLVTGIAARKKYPDDVIIIGLNHLGLMMREAEYEAFDALKTMAEDAGIIVFATTHSKRFVIGELIEPFFTFNVEKNARDNYMLN